MSQSSIVEFYGPGDPHHCGYCNKNGSITDGMTAHRLTVADYQMMIDRGWRRSGTYCYKPNIESSCCKLYTIRCEAMQLRLRRSHKRVIRQFNTFLQTGSHPKMNSKATLANSSPGMQPVASETVGENAKQKCEDKLASSDSQKQKAESKAKAKRWARRLDHFRSLAERNKTSFDEILEKYRERRAARLTRRQAKSVEIRLLENLNKSQTESASNKQSPSSSSKSNEKAAASERSTKEAKHKLEIRLVKSNDEDDETFQQTFKSVYRLYDMYQSSVHHDSNNSTRRFRNFLCQSPLSYEKCKCGQRGCTLEYGSFHQHYLLDGKLIMVGVIDILPRCVSSVYLFYDPAYAFLSLGTYSALRELEFVRHLHAHTACLNTSSSAPATLKSIDYYYLGFYIDTCVKMRYKGQHRPSFLLCPETFTWQPIEPCLPLIRQRGYTRLADASAFDTQLFADSNASSRVPQKIAAAPFVGSILVFTPAGAVDYRSLKRQQQNSQQEKDLLLRYIVVVGKTLSQRMVLYLG